MSRIALMANAVARRLDLMFPGYFAGAKHNHYADFGYPDAVTFALAYDMYVRNGLAAAAVNKTVAKTWQDNPFVQEFQRDGTESGEQGETKTERDIRVRFEVLRLWQNLAEADARGMVGAYAGLILRLADGKRFSEPVDRVSGGLEALVEVIPAWEGQLEVSQWETDETSPDYGKPKQFRFNEAAVKGSSKQPRQLEIHPDRVLVWSRDGTVHGRSSLAPGFNSLIDMEKISGGGGEGFWRNAKSAPIIEVDKDAKPEQLARSMGVSPDELADRINDQVNDYLRGFDSMLMLQGMKASPASVTLPSPEHFFGIALQTFAASMLIPMKILVGSQTGERASTEDAEEWDRTCMARRTNHVLPGIRQLIERLVRFGMLPENDWHIAWTDLTESSLGEKIDRAVKMASVNNTMKDSGELIFSPEEIRAVVDMEPLSDAEKFRDEDDSDEDLDPNDAALDDALNAGGGRSAARPFVGSARPKKRTRSGPPRKGFNPLQPRGGDGRWIDSGAAIDRARLLAGQNVAHHEHFGMVRQEASKVAGMDLRGFHHSVSNQAIKHMQDRHPNLTDVDFRRMAKVVKVKPTLSADTGINGVPRLVYRARVDGVLYEYVGEVRRRKGRLDAITFYRV